MEVPSYDRRSLVGAEGPPGPPTISGPDLNWYWGANDPVERGNIDLFNRPIVMHPDGGWSTVRTLGFEDNDGKQVLLPTIGPKGEDWSDDDAINHYRRTGQHLGKYLDIDSSNRAAQRLHEEQEEHYLPYVRQMREARQPRLDFEAAPLGQSHTVPPGVSPRSDIGRSGYVTASGRPKVSYAGVNPAMLSAANNVGLKLGQPLEITSARDSVHSKGSHHYTGNALDIRDRNMTPEQRANTVAELRNAGFSVLVEKDHIHASFKGGNIDMIADTKDKMKAAWYDPRTWFGDNEEYSGGFAGPLADRLPEHNQGPLADRLEYQGNAEYQWSDTKAGVPWGGRGLADRLWWQGEEATPRFDPFGRQRPSVNYIPPRWPTKEEVEAWRASGMSYGDRNAALMDIGFKLWQFNNQAQADRWLTAAMDVKIPSREAIKEFQIYFRELSEEQRQRLIEAYVAVQPSPVAKLGFDVRQMVTTEGATRNRAGYAGIYDPLTEKNPPRESTDRMWFDAARLDSFKATPIHESSHRGVRKLINSGKLRGIPILEDLEYDYHLEEVMTRAIVIKYHGMMELTNPNTKEGDFPSTDQVFEAGRRLKEPKFAKAVEKLEQLASELAMEERQVQFKGAGGSRFRSGGPR